MKTLLQHIREKLRIGKDWNPTPNETFYNKFRNIYEDKEFGWMESPNIKSILPINMPFIWRGHVKEFFEDKEVYVRYATDNKYLHLERDTYYNMLKFIKDDPYFECTYKNIKTYNKSSNYFVYLFETGDLKAAIWGYTLLDSSKKGTMVFQHNY